MIAGRWAGVVVAVFFVFVAPACGEVEGQGLTFMFGDDEIAIPDSYKAIVQLDGKVTYRNDSYDGPMAGLIGVEVGLEAEHFLFNIDSGVDRRFLCGAGSWSIAGKVLLHGDDVLYNVAFIHDSRRALVVVSYDSALWRWILSTIDSHSLGRGSGGGTVNCKDVEHK